MKNVIIIGNGRGVLQKQYGKFIDSFDIVVRINKFRIKGYEKNVGTKTDYISFCEPVFYEFIQPENKRRLDFYKNNKKNLEHLIKIWQNQGKSKQDIIKYIRILRKNYLFKPEPISNENIKYLCFFKEIQTNKFISDKCIFLNTNDTIDYSTGFKTIKYFLNQNYFINIIGFDFFEKSSHYFLDTFDLFTEQKLISDRTKNFTDGHPYSLEKNIIENLIKNNTLKILN